MIDLPRYDGGFQDPRLDQFVRDLLKSLKNVVDLSVYEVASVVWKNGTKMSVPYPTGKPRTVQPKSVVCTRARSLSTPLVPVSFGSCDWTWLGDNQVQLNSIDGLVEGTPYALTLEVIS